jgi:hypothetical protein
MKNNKLKIGIFSMILSTSVLAGPFDTFRDSGRTTNPEGPEESIGLMEGYKKITKKAVSQVVSKSNSTTAEKAEARSKGISVEQVKQRKLQEFLKSQIKKQQSILSETYSKTQFVKKDKRITIKNKDKYLDIFIPFNNQSNIEFDESIKEISFLEQSGVVIRQKKNSKKKLEILNKNPNLMINVKLEFVSGKELTLVIQTGDTATKRYVDYQLFTDGSSLATKTLFVKATKVKTIHNDFNNKALYLILSRIQKNGFYQQLRENITTVEQILFSGETQVETLYGLKDIDYTIILNNLYESPYIQTDKKDLRQKNRLILMEMTIKNDHNSETLSVNETLIKNRFGNFVAMWLGDLDSSQNILGPKEELKFLIVISDPYEN